jgi:hypothetical protein
MRTSRMNKLLPVPFIIAIYIFAYLLPCSAFALQEIKSKSSKYGKKELNDLLAKVRQKSELDLANLRDYVFSETEIFQTGNRIEYAWVVRDGYLLRSPVLINGERVSPSEQKAYEDRWIKARQNGGKLKNSFDFFIDCAKDYMFAWPSLSHSTATARLEAAFTRHFTDLMTKPPAKYNYSGELLFEGRKVIALKYNTETYEGLLKHLVTLFISPEECQLVGIAFHEETDYGVKSNYLMVMDKPIGDIWLPKRFSFFFECWSN